MTCIVGITHNGNVIIGGDSCGSTGRATRQRADPKVFKNGEFVIGFTDSFRMGQLLNYKFTPPPIAEDQDVFAYMATSFVESVRQCLKDGGYTIVQNNEETGGSFLVGYRGRLFHIESDFQVSEVLDSYDATGCGMEYALGSLHTTAESDDEYPADRLTAALDAASYFSPFVSAPYVILSTNQD